MSTRRSLAAVAGLALLGLAGAARADTLDLSVTTLLAGRQDWRDGKLYTVVPVYQSLLVQADLKVPYLDELRFDLSGWGSVDAADTRGSAAADLDVANVRGTVWKGRLALRAGRMFVRGGAARMLQLDGGELTAFVFRGLGVSIYGGAPVTPRFATSRGDAVGGARVFYRHSNDTELGLSFVDVLGQGRAARMDAAVDGRWAPHRTVALTGLGLYSLLEHRLAQAQLAIQWQPVAIFLATAEYRRVSPDLFLPLNSILAVFSQETRDEVGATFWVRAHRKVQIDGDYRFVSDAAGFGHRAGLRLSSTIGNTSFAAEGRLLHLPRSGYGEARLHGQQRIAALILALDADAYILEQPLNGQRFSFVTSGTVGWDFAASWRAVVTGFADVTPFYQQRFEVVARLVFNPTLRVHESRP